MGDILKSISSPKEETGSQGKSELCVSTSHNTRLPENIVTGVTVQLSLLSLRCDGKVSGCLKSANIHS